MDAKLVAVGHQADFVDQPADDLAGFLPCLLGIQRLGQVLDLLSVGLGKVEVQPDGWRRLRGQLLLDRPLVPFKLRVLRKPPP